MSIPKIVFIVPYRDRIHHKFFFCKQMQFILENVNDYEIYFSNQCDDRGFNRGAMKNVGFLAVKNKYPDDYQNMTFVFHDVDTLPFNKIFQYETQPGIVKHFYGFKFALGGIVCIHGSDFEKINGYPCYWGWGMEDNVLQKRCIENGLTIDRSVFYPIGSPEILQLFEGIKRLINRDDPNNDLDIDSRNGLSTIYNLEYTMDMKSPNVKDNIFTVPGFTTEYVNITRFETMLSYQSNYYDYDLRDVENSPPKKERPFRQMLQEHPSIFSGNKNQMWKQPKMQMNSLPKMKMFQFK